MPLPHELSPNPRQRGNVCGLLRRRAAGLITGLDPAGRWTADAPHAS